MAKVRGLDIYVKYNAGTYEEPSWQKIGGQRDATLTFSGEEIDVSDKDNAGWADSLIGFNSAEIEFDAFLIEDDTGWGVLEDSFFNGTKVDLQLYIGTSPSHAYRGYFYVTKLPIKAGVKDAATVSFTLKAAGAISYS